MEHECKYYRGTGWRRSGVICSCPAGMAEIRRWRYLCQKCKIYIDSNVDDHETYCADCRLLLGIEG